LLIFLNLLEIFEVNSQIWIVFLSQSLLQVDHGPNKI
jgi:hypothetical protein